MRCAFPGRVAAALLLASSVLFAETVTGVSVTGNVVKLTLGANVCELTPINDYTVKVEYKPNGQTFKASEVIDSALSSTLNFADVQQGGDPVVLTGANYIVSIAKNPFAITFTDKAGTQLFKSTALTGTEIGCQIVSGNYYGFRNDPTSNNLLVSALADKTIDPSYQGRACSPFLWTPKNFGILFDAEKGSISLTGTTLRILRTNAMNKNTLFFLMTGSPRQIMQNYYRVTNPFPMPPLWTMGFMNSEWGLNESEMMTQNRTYRERDIPIDARILDYDWITQYPSQLTDTYKWNAQKFPSALSGALKKTCDSMGIKMVGIRKPFGAGYNWNTELYNPATQASFWRLFIDPAYNSYERGIIAYWLDEMDWGKEPFVGLYAAKSMFNGQRSYNNLRPWTINRNYFGGAHRYGYALWSGDIQTEWSEMSNQRGFMLGSVNLGAAWWSMDICGFWGGGWASLYTRWMQFGAFVPVYRTHGVENMQRQPWAYPKDADTLSANFIRLRYTLIPYIYSSYWKLHLDGLPIVRPLVMDYPNDAATANRIDCYMFGEAFHVTPVVTGPAVTADPAAFVPVAVRTYLPAGKWVNFWNDSLVDGGKELTLTVPKQIIPVYVKQGSVVPRRPHGRYAEDPLVTEINFHVYTGANGTFDYFEDDGNTVDYLSGKYCRLRYDHQSTAGQEAVNISSVTAGYTPAAKTGYFTFHNVAAKPLTVLEQTGDISARFVASGIATAAAPAWTYDAAKQLVTVKVTNPYAAGTVGISSGTMSAGAMSAGLAGAPEVTVHRQRTGVSVTLAWASAAPARAMIFDMRGRLISSSMLQREVSGPARAVLSAPAGATYLLKVVSESQVIASRTIAAR